MAVIVMVYGQSGTGKSTSLRNFAPEDVCIVNVSGKPLPFRNKHKTFKTDDYMAIDAAIRKAPAKSIVIDDATYLMTGEYMRTAKVTGYQKFVDMALNYYTFHGLYTWNIPKDGWMFGLVEDTTKTQAIVGADDHTAATQMKEASMTGFEVEFVSDEDNADWVITSLTRMLSAVINSDGSDLDTTVAQYLDLDSCIDHYIHTVVDKATDCVDKNYLLVTFDGVKWYMSAYDRDSIHGLNWDASGTTRPVSNVSFQECADAVRVFDLIKRYKTDQLKDRYNKLRANILSESRIMQTFENFAWAIPSPIMAEDVKLYPTIKGSGVNTIDQIGRFVRQRLETCDAWIEKL